MTKVVGAASRMRKTVQAKKDGELGEEKVKDSVGKVQQFDGPPAEVSFDLKSVINMGQYQSLHVGVGVTVPCATANAQATFEKAVAFVFKNMNTTIAEAKEELFGGSPEPGVLEDL